MAHEIRTQDVEYRQRLKNRKKRALKKDLFVNLSLLLLPLVCLSIIILLVPITYCLSLFLIYFILPMFYTVDKRLRFALTGIGKPNFSYADGYRDFFSGSRGGIFGVILTIFTALVFTLLLYLIFSLILEPLVNCFPDAVDVIMEVDRLLELGDSSDAYAYMEANIAYVIPPLSIFAGIIFFLPSLYVVFFSVDSNLSQHYLCTIVLPDIDKNISASQARSLSRTTFWRLLFGDRTKHLFASNWPYYVAYVVIYGVVLFLCSFMTSDNVYLALIVIMAAPTISMFFGYVMNYFCQLNDYAFFEENQITLLSRMPNNMKASIYNTYSNPHYVHGEESAARGCFVPEANYGFNPNDADPFGSGSFGGFGRNHHRQERNDDTYTTYDSSNKQEDADMKTDYGTSTNSSASSETKEEPTGVVIDLSGENDKNDKKDS